MKKTIYKICKCKTCDHVFFELEEHFTKGKWKLFSFCKHKCPECDSKCRYASKISKDKKLMDKKKRILQKYRCGDCNHTFYLTFYGNKLPLVKLCTKCKNISAKVDGIVSKGIRHLEVLEALIEKINKG